MMNAPMHVSTVTPADNRQNFPPSDCITMPFILFCRECTIQMDEQKYGEDMEAPVLNHRCRHGCKCCLAALPSTSKQVGSGDKKMYGGWHSKDCCWCSKTLCSWSRTLRSRLRHPHSACVLVGQIRLATSYHQWNNCSTRFPTTQCRLQFEHSFTLRELDK